MIGFILCLVKGQLLHTWMLQHHTEEVALNNYVVVERDDLIYAQEQMLGTDEKVEKQKIEEERKEEEWNYARRDELKAEHYALKLLPSGKDDDTIIVEVFCFLLLHVNHCHPSGGLLAIACSLKRRLH